ncbi:VOC family protein [Nocardia sp. NPDC051030]|uniref:VOC family protein n=1 Tax=Nocardia sp. NPDC051030 TaxID=3155162 RepID=UPI003430D168
MSELDHLVLATPHLTETVRTVADLLGIEPVPGGQHVGRGTRNYLLGLGNGGYLELIGPDPDQPDPAQPRPFGLDTLAEPRLITWAVQTTDIDAAIATARTAGYDPGDASNLSRATPAGDLLSWRLTYPRVNLGEASLVPFLIDWGTTRHPSLDLPQSKLLSLTAIHPDPHPTRTHLEALSATLEVRPGLRPTLIATLDGPQGPVTLL